MKLHRVTITLEGRDNDTLFLAPYVHFQLHDLTYLKVIPVSLKINEGTFVVPGNPGEQPRVGVKQAADYIEFTCNCSASNETLCEHQLLVINAIARREELAVFFQKKKRFEIIRRAAADYGLEKEEDLDKHFRIRLEERTLTVNPRVEGLVPVAGATFEKYLHELFPAIRDQYHSHPTPKKEHIIVFRKHKYYHHLQAGIYEVFLTKQGTLKNPVTEADLHTLAWYRENGSLLKFFMAVSRFQGYKETGVDEGDLRALKTIVTQHPGYRFYVHQEHISDQITAASLLPIEVNCFSGDCILTIVRKGMLMEMSMRIKWEGKVYALKDFDLRFGCFLVKNNQYLLIDHLPLYSVIHFFRKQYDPLKVHMGKFRDFQVKILDKIQDIVIIEYADMQPATPRQMAERAHHLPPEKIIYLSDSGNYVHIHPVMCYGEIEIPIRTKRLIFDSDEKGKPFQVRRNEERETAFTSILIRQHPDFSEQLENSLPYFYLHKKYFLDESWFLDVFEEWRTQGIQILGFNELEGNKVSPDNARVQVQVGSGINWFNAEIDVKYGKKRAKLKNLQAAVVNKRKYVELDDGTLGILPVEWIERFRQFFESGDISKKDTLNIPWINFASIDKYFDQEMLEAEAWQQLQFFKQKLDNFEEIEPVLIPATFSGTLRNYQHSGLNWLNFLDQFNFGGCLADDMGLGKSAQMIALMLLQKERLGNPTNLIVVPTSLLYNWQEEIRKFAPGLSVLIYNGTSRSSFLSQLGNYDVVLISYNTVIADCMYLKKITFNTIVLDESQYIKNPETQRYKSVSLLRARNRFVMTGTPIENHTSDLYSQLSFACPGLLGGKRAFRDLYTAPIDQFKDQKRARELQLKIRPFVLRRTKNEVAKELPEKSEVVIYCEMQPWQRKIYDGYEKEFRDFIDATTGDELRKDPMHVLKGLTQLRQICNSPSLIKGVQVPDNQLSAKMEVLIDKINETVEDHKILIFSQFVTMLDLIAVQLQEHGIGYTLLTGATRNRQGEIEEFRKNPEIRVFLISLKAGGTGLTLTEADYVFLVDPWWNPAVEAQAIDRAYRIGQTNNVIAFRLICKDTIEEKMQDMQENKKQLADTLIKEEPDILTSLSKDDLLRLLNK